MGHEHLEEKGLMEHAAHSKRDVFEEEDEEDKKGYHLLPTKSELKFFIAISALVAILYTGAYFCMGSFVLPGNTVFPILLIWVCAHLVGYLITKIKMPSLLGMLLAGMILANLPGSPVASLDKKWAKEIKYGALAIIFLRSGLEQDLEVFKRVGAVAVRLLLIPGIVEALVSGLVGWPVFGMPILLALAMGFILKPVDPAIAIQLMFDIQEAGKGRKKGIPSLVVAAASFDDLVAITLYTLFISFALPPTEGQSQVFQILKGPLNIVLGLVLGALGALICSCSKIWNTTTLRNVVVISMALTQMYVCIKYDFSGAGVLSAIVLGVGVNLLWSKGLPPYLSSGRNPHYGTTVEHHVAQFWDFIAQPLLFGIVGTAVHFKYINTSIIPKSILVIFSGWLARMPTTFFAVMNAGLTWKERLFVTFAWTPKASVQAALATGPLDQIMAKGLEGDWLTWGEEIMVTALFAVIICGPIGVILTTLGAKYLIKPDAPDTGVSFAEGNEEDEISGLGAGLEVEQADKGSIMRLPSFVEQVDDEVDYEKREDLYEEEVLAENNARLGRLLTQLEHDIEEMKDMCAADSEKAQAASVMHYHLRRLRKELIRNEVPSPDRIDGAREFFMRSMRDVYKAKPSALPAGARHGQELRQRNSVSGSGVGGSRVPSIDPEV